MTTDELVELSVLHDAGTDESNPTLKVFAKISEAIDKLPAQPAQSFEELEAKVFAEVERSVPASVRNIAFNMFGF